MMGKLEPGMLAGDEQPRPLAKRGERMRNWTKLDRFRTRPND